MKVGIVTYHKAHNYGAFLQAYALSSRLNMESGINAEVINFTMDSEVKSYKVPFSKNIFRTIHDFKKYKMFNSIALPFLSAASCTIVTSEEEFRTLVNKKYDVIIAGSDEIWKINKRRIFPNPYWLPGDYGCIKMAYAASGRCEYSKMGNSIRNQVKNFLSSFAYVGVRDRSTKKYLIECDLALDIELNCDPTFLYDFQIDKEEARKKIHNRYHITDDKKIILVMYGSKELIKILKTMVRSDAKIISVYDWNYGVLNLPSITPIEWIELIAASDLVITKYFHACCFSIINNTAFLAIEERAECREDSKLYDLCSEFNCLNRFSLKLSEAVQHGNFERIWKSVKNNETVNYLREIESYRNRSSSFFERLHEIKDELTRIKQY